jgi:hypothetical protein
MSYPVVSHSEQVYNAIGLLGVKPVRGNDIELY